MKKYMDWLTAAAGALLWIVGFGMMRMGGALPYVCIGLGCGLFGHGVGALASRWALKDSPELRRQIEIDQKDERNAAIAARAKGRAFDMMTFVFGALMVSFALMRVELSAVLLLVFAYLLVHGCALYWRFRYEREI